MFRTSNISKFDVRSGITRFYLTLLSNHPRLFIDIDIVQYL